MKDALNIMDPVNIQAHLEGLRKQQNEVQEQLNAADYLDQAKAIFKERNAKYGDSYKEVGLLLFAMFPNGIELRSVADHNRFCVFLHCIDKLRRYATNLQDGGHADSALDLSVYAAMLRELTVDEE